MPRLASHISGCRFFSSSPVLTLYQLVGSSSASELNCGEIRTVFSQYQTMIACHWNWTSHWQCKIFPTPFLSWPHRDSLVAGIFRPGWPCCKSASPITPLSSWNCDMIQVIVFALPLQFILIMIMFNQLKKGVKITDKRARLTTEVLQGIRLIKAYGWEAFYTRQNALLRK